MPALKDLESFKNTLANLSEEPAWRAEKGEEFSEEKEVSSNIASDGEQTALENTVTEAALISQQNESDESAETNNAAFDIPFDLDEIPVSHVASSIPKHEEKETVLFSEKDIAAVEQALNQLQRNLRIAVEEVLSSSETPEYAVQDLVQALINGENLRAIAGKVHEASGQTIIIPHFYQQKSGRDFIKSQNSFVGLFKVLAWPILKKTITLAIMAGLGILGVFHWVYRPIMAERCYKAGCALVHNEQYDAGEQKFHTALNGWKLGFISVAGIKKEKWFYKYADAYSERREFARAEQKYEELLQYYPNSKKAYLTYGAFEGIKHGNYAKADRIYGQYIANVGASDIDILLASADNLFEWGALEPGKTELARQGYADVQFRLKKFAPSLGVRFLRYAIRVNNQTEIDRWSRYFLHLLSQKNARFHAPSHAMAELAGWYLDHQQVIVARDILYKIINKDPNDASVLYQWARYWNYEGSDLNKEEQILQRVYCALTQYTSLTWQQTDMLIDVYRRLGQVYMRQKQEARAEENFNKAIMTYEEAVRGKVLSVQSKYGEIYKELGDLYYDCKKDDYAALICFSKALEKNCDTPEVRYKRGYIYYSQKDYQEALTDLHLSFEGSPDNAHALFGYATVLAQRGGYAVAEAIYEKLRILLEREKSSQTSSEPGRPEDQQRKLINLLAKTYNNLAVVRYAISRSSSESSRYCALAQANLGQAVAYGDCLTRDAETFARTPDTLVSQKNFQSITFSPRMPTLFTSLPRQFDFSVQEDFDKTSSLKTSERS